MTLLDEARAAVADEHSRDQLSTEGDREIRLARALLELDALILDIDDHDLTDTQTKVNQRLDALLSAWRRLRGAP